jgi:hypothetical protein
LPTNWISKHLLKRVEPGRLGRLPVRSDHHLQPRQAFLALALLAQQIALAEDADDAGGRVQPTRCSSISLAAASKVVSGVLVTTRRVMKSSTRTFALRRKLSLSTVI